MDEKLITESLSPMERGVLGVLSKGFLNSEELAEKSKLDKTTVLRAIGLLEKKDLIEVKNSEVKRVDIGILGVNYLKKELPERVLLNKLSEKSVIPIGEIKNVCGLNYNEAKIALGVLKKKAVIEIDKGRLKLIAKGEEVAMKMIEEVFMEKLPMNLEDVKDGDALALENLKKLGVVIAIDDFGTGYSSLSYLQQFPIDKVKIDRSFIKNITENKDSVSIVKAIIALAHSLNLTVISEGVETQAQYDLLRNMNCDEAQGFYFGPAISAEEFEDFVTKS